MYPLMPWIWSVRKRGHKNETKMFSLNNQKPFIGMEKTMGKSDLVKESRSCKQRCHVDWGEGELMLSPQMPFKVMRPDDFKLCRMYQKSLRAEPWCMPVFKWQNGEEDTAKESANVRQ